MYGGLDELVNDFALVSDDLNYLERPHNQFRPSLRYVEERI